MSETQEAKWYVVHTYSGYENKVANDLAIVVENRGMQDLIHDIKIPTETVTEIKDDKKREIERKIFPGYVLIKMIVTDDSWYVVRNIRGCTGFVGPASKPVPLTETEMKTLGISTQEISVDFKEGDTVAVIAGVWKDTVGVVQRMDFGKQTATINVEMFGRETPVEIGFAEVKSM